LRKKIDIVLRIQDPILLRFTFFLILEEVYDHSHLIRKVESELNQEMKNKIYMFFFFFSHFGALQHNFQSQRQQGMHENNADTMDYIAFLEKQVESTNNAKRQYLEEINQILQKENQQQHQEEMFFSRDESGTSSPVKSFSPEKSRYTETEEKEFFLRKSSFLNSEKPEDIIKEEEEEEKQQSQEFAALPPEIDLDFKSILEAESKNHSLTQDQLESSPSKFQSATSSIIESPIKRRINKNKSLHKHH